MKAARNPMTAVRVPQSGRYQKTGGKSPRGADARAGLRRWLPLLALFTAACAPVDAQQRTAAVSPQPQPAAQAPQPAIAVPPAVLAGLPPTADTPALAAVVAAREAMNRKQWSVLGALVPQAKSDPLGMYPEYWLLRYQLWSPPAGGRPNTDLQKFINGNGDAYLADRLRADWLLAAARSGDFDLVRKLAPVKNSNAQVECAVLNARHMTGQRATAAQAVAVFAPGGACWTLYDQLVADNVLGWEQLEPQLRDAIEANKTTDARKFVQYMFEPRDQKTYDVLIKDPMRWLTRQDRLPVGRNEKELVTIALARLARSDINVADSYLRREWAKSMAKSNLAWIRGQYALVAALNLDSRADDWYHEAGHIRMTEYNAGWKVRAALRQPKIDWKWVIESIDQMPQAQQQDPSWIYWKARGMAATGRRDQANAAYASIADRFDFYGQLSAEELGRRITVPPRPVPISDSEIAEARANPGLRRAVQLFRLGWRQEAVPEWNYALRGMSDRQLLAAAELARAENIYDRVVNTSDRTEKEFDFSQRFIAPFEGRVTAKANAIALDPAWVYGLIRQESRFIMDARSHVGASGLMQLMPATAKWVAGKIGMSNFTPDSVNDFDTNTELGTNYLNMVLRDLNGSQMLASAGYNAGPRRPHNWRSTFNHPVEGAIFAETIPFNETRTYVKNVMSNSVYYAAMFSGQSQSLKERLGNVVPLGAESTTLP